MSPLLSQLILTPSLSSNFQDLCSTSLLPQSKQKEISSGSHHPAIHLLIFLPVFMLCPHLQGWHQHFYLHLWTRAYPSSPLKTIGPEILLHHQFLLLHTASYSQTYKHAVIFPTLKQKPNKNALDQVSWIASSHCFASITVWGKLCKSCLCLLHSVLLPSLLNPFRCCFHSASTGTTFGKATNDLQVTKFNGWFLVLIFLT